MFFSTIYLEYWIFLLDISTSFCKNNFAILNCPQGRRSLTISINTGAAGPPQFNFIYIFTIEPIFYPLQGNPGSCLAIFIPALVVGNFMVLNLFLALLLNNFNSDELKQRKEVQKLSTFHTLVRHSRPYFHILYIPCIVEIHLSSNTDPYYVLFTSFYFTLMKQVATFIFKTLKIQFLVHKNPNPLSLLGTLFCFAF